MSAKNTKKKTPSWFLYGLVTIMLAVLLVQMIFPTNLEKVLDKHAKNPTEITVTVVSDSAENHSYHTDSDEKIEAFIQWASAKSLRHRSLADGISVDNSNKTEYNFAIRTSDGNYSGIVIDKKGFIHVGAELYKITDDADSFINELTRQLESWM